MVKSDDQSLFTNYRPISVLPSFSKFFERVIYNRLMQYLMNFNILCSNQYGFRKNHSTALALIDLHDKISTAFDRGEFSVGIFLDLSKAFDTVNHVILFDKLEHYGIRGLALDWIRSYFSNRKQYVEYNGHRSSRNEISCGVFQGSILGPLFFLLYINDINNRSICNIQISILDNQNIVKVKETNFLGVILDENLNWKSEISHVAKKVAKSIGIISRCSFFFPKTSLRMLYYSLIYPYFYYCNIIWASTNLRRLVILQKRIIRIINKSHFNVHTDPIFKDLGILKFNDIHLLQLGQFMYSCKNSFLPPKFNNNFSQSNQFHSYNTRNSQAYRLPYCRTNTKKFSPFFQGPKFFNSLDNEVINSQSLSSFKKKLKIKLLSKYENSS